jgi:TonB family protein
MGRPRLLNMRWCFAFLFLSLFFGCAQNAVSQGPQSEDKPDTGVVLTRLSPPVYPPLARQAQIAGDVKVQVSIRKDGSVESAEVIEGHPMLKQSALDSAKDSQFECRDCKNVESYSLTYTFAIDNSNGSEPGPCCCSHLSGEAKHFDPRIERLLDHVSVTVIAEPVCICPDECDMRWAEQHSRFRASKCFTSGNVGFAE